MYLREFMRRLSVVKDHPGFQEWYMNDDGEIRCLIKVGCDPNCVYCPITAVELCLHDVSLIPEDYERAANNLRISNNMREAVIFAADFPEGYDGWNISILGIRKKVVRDALLNVTKALTVT